MNDIEFITYINDLYDLYSNLLTKKQKRIFELYYQYNLSLKEISIELKISRNAALDSLETSKKHLEEYEFKLNLLKRINKIKMNKSINDKDKEIIIKILKE